jgi:hypothetical protein
VTRPPDPSPDSGTEGGPGAELLLAAAGSLFGVFGSAHGSSQFAGGGRSSLAGTCRRGCAPRPFALEAVMEMSMKQAAFVLAHPISHRIGGRTR